MLVKSLTAIFAAAITTLSLQTNIVLAGTCEDNLQKFVSYNDEFSSITAKLESLRVSEISEDLLRAAQLTMAAMYAVSGSILDNNCLSGSQKNEMIIINRALKERLR